jgi:hypothetical protein
MQCQRQRHVNQTYIPFPPFSFLQRIPKERTVVTHMQELVLRVPAPDLLLGHQITLSIQPTVHRSQDQRNNGRGQHNGEAEAVANKVMRRHARKEDVGANEATSEVSERDEQSHADGALAGWSEVVC